jgi:YVTN family beta-propeller protein
VGGCVGGVAVSPDGRYVYGPAFYDGTLSRFDSQNSYAKATITLGSWADKLWISADGTRLIANYNSPNGDPSTSQTLALVDIVGGSFSILKTLSMGRPVSRGPIAFSQSGNYMYVACCSNMTSGPSVLRVSMDTFSISGSLEVASGAGVTSSLAGVVRVGNTLYVGDSANNAVYMVDEATLAKTATTSLPYSPSAIGLYPSEKYLFVLYGGNGEISVLKLPNLSVVTTLTGLNPAMSDVVFSADGKTAYVAHADTTLGGFSVVEVK